MSMQHDTASRFKAMVRAFVCSAVIVCSSSELRAQLKITFVDVGQGDAVYIELPNGKNALIDGGPSGGIIDGFLKSKGVSRINYVALTHPHSDHYRGLKKVFNSYQIDNYYDTKAENVDAKGDNNLRELAEQEPGCVTHYPKPGELLAWDPEVTVKVFNACYAPVLMHDNDETNSCSLVVRLYYNGSGVLLTGDANFQIEREMLSHFKSGLQSNILKVGHHGSRTSTSEAFLARVRPDYAIISVGLNNNYGHPHQEAIDRLRKAGAKIYMTTQGTQILTIPAPGRDWSPVQPVFEGYEATPEQKLVDMSLTWNPAATKNPDSKAFGQLKDQAAQ